MEKLTPLTTGISLVKEPIIPQMVGKGQRELTPLIPTTSDTKLLAILRLARILHKRLQVTHRLRGVLVGLERVPFLKNPQ